MSNRDYLTLIGIDTYDAKYTKPDAVDLLYEGFPYRALLILEGTTPFIIALQGYAMSLQDDGKTHDEITCALQRQLMYYNERYTKR
jgi:hypothetical protein